MRWVRWTVLVASMLIGGTSPASAQGNGSTATRFPIVLQPGLANLGFFGVANSLRAGGARVFETQSDAFNNSTIRGQQLLRQIQQIVAITGAQKVNLIGHSQGGLDARFVLGTRPQLLASVTTVSTPHLGAELATLLANPVLSVTTLPLSTALINAINLIRGQGFATPGQLLRAAGQLSAGGAAAFNRRFPAGLPSQRCGQGAASANGVVLSSWGGVGQRTNAVDPTDALLALTGAVYREANDGLVGRCSNHFGVVIRDNFRMNHLDEVNQLNGLVGPDNPLAQYRATAIRLRNQGL